jgi:hypothetical protein
MYVGATTPELFAVLDELKGWSEEKRAEVVERLEEYREKTSYWRCEPVVAWAPCAFLKEGLCSIYGVRPLSCRMHSSYEPNECRRHFRKLDPRAKRMQVKGQAEIADGIVRATIGALLSSGKPSGLIDLPNAILAILENPEALEPFSPNNDLLNRFNVLSELKGAPQPMAYECLRLKESSAYTAWSELLSQKRTIAAAELDGLTNPTIQAFARLAAIPPFYETQGELEETWERKVADLDRFVETPLNPKDAFEAIWLFDLFNLPYMGKNVRPFMQRLMSHAYEKFALPAYPHLAAPPEGPRKPGRFRLGYAGFRLKGFNGTQWARGWLMNHSPEIETFVFHLGADEDRVTNQWRRIADHYRHLLMPVAQAAEAIREYDLDALIIPDIGMDGINLQLALLRMARVQLTAWGHPVTSGSPAIDYYLSSEMMEPPDGDDHYTEKLVRLPGSGLTYPAFDYKSDTQKTGDIDLPANGFYMVAQYFGKLLPSEDHLYREIAERSGKPIVFIGAKQEGLRLAFEARLKQAGIPAIVLPFMAPPDFMRVIQLSDAVLDSPSWNGGNTTMMALALRKPVITLPGAFMRGRHGLAFLPLSGAEALIARDEAEYVALALDTDRQQEVVRGLHPESMFMDRRPVQAIDELLLSAMDTR